MMNLASFVAGVFVGIAWAAVILYFSDARRARFERRLRSELRRSVERQERSSS